ncbi:hypothetical protein [Streptomonospora wellingtoniae]|uniref:Uncharacterized protein n=1 Tax=Streptomonospora wellingtoniae TaxID=3075544 RepID=A0ABU2KX20_9ACTN|nr:hypothetical protein [Streptomonospora sp. DSM 45055]MDT0303712.1 hypothetical protein [Streptomonospora sp. DSM 45055]
MDAGRLFVIALMLVFAAVLAAVAVTPDLVPRRTNLHDRPRTRAAALMGDRVTAALLPAMVLLALFSPSTWRPDA